MERHSTDILKCMGDDGPPDANQISNQPRDRSKVKRQARDGNQFGGCTRFSVRALR
jgi:hypothetical protein